MIKFIREEPIEAIFYTILVSVSIFIVTVLIIHHHQTLSTYMDNGYAPVENTITIDINLRESKHILVKGDKRAECVIYQDSTPLQFYSKCSRIN